MRTDGGVAALATRDSRLRHPALVTPPGPEWSPTVPPRHDDRDYESHPEQGLTNSARSHLTLEGDELTGIAGIISECIAEQSNKEARRAEDGELWPTRMRRQFGSHFGGQRRHDTGQQRNLTENFDAVR